MNNINTITKQIKYDKLIKYILSIFPSIDFSDKRIFSIWKAFELFELLYIGKDKKYFYFINSDSLTIYKIENDQMNINKDTDISINLYSVIKAVNSQVLFNRQMRLRYLRN